MEWEQFQTIADFDHALEKQIQKTRVHDFQVQVLDSLGNAVSGVKINAKHINHDFIFGVCPNGHISMANHLACKESEEAEIYWERIGNLFNAITLWWGWRVLEPTIGKHTFDQEEAGYGPMERMIERAEKLGLKLTAHAILYPREDVCPEWLSKCLEEEALVYLERHVKETVQRYRNRISTWHPVNEAYDVIQNIGPLHVNEGLVYKWISELAPHADIVNNGGHTIEPEFYEKGIKNAEKFGGRVDDLGIRGYFELYSTDSLSFYQSMWEHYSYLAKRYNKGVRFTEIGATSAARQGEYSPWDVDHTVSRQLGIADFDEFRKNSVMNEETQAEFLKRMYSMAFAHPSLKECTYWDICDAYTWNGVEGGLIRKDLSAKPAYHELRKLIHETWSTEVSLETDENGNCSFCGFDGQYEVHINGKKHSICLNQKSQKGILIV